jgi:FkbH-like protein
MDSTSAPASAVDWLRQRLADGDLPDRYPELAPRLGTAGPAEVRQAGTLLQRVAPELVLAAHPDTPVVRVAVTGHSTLDAVRAPLTGELARHGLMLEATMTDFDSYLFTLSDPGSELYQAEPDLALCVLDPWLVFDEVPTPWRVEDVEAVLKAKLTLLDGLARTFSTAGRGVLVYNTIPLPAQFADQLIDLRSRARLGAVWREANAALLRMTDDHPAVVVLDLDPVLADGVPLSDARMSAYAKAHLSAELLARYAHRAAHLARVLTGRTKKVLALDLDNTLWGGILGDDGIEGIEIGDGHRGEAFAAFQRVAKQLGGQGVLLAAVSKNDSGPVGEALREHPGMVLREEDFVRVSADWQPKHLRLTELATDLGLGVDSVVFVDDSAYECGLVREKLPQVAVVAVDAEPARHLGALLADGWFDARELTADDRHRPARYREELVRKDFLESFDSVRDYLAELGVRIRLAPPTAAELTRVSQLTLRTNQFNLTTERLQPDRVHELAGDASALLLAVHASDRFGDNGLVGAVLGHRREDALEIDNFLLSCRVFSRGIEQAALSTVLAHAKATGAREVRASYRRTAKNGKVAKFYPRNGFTVVAEDDTSAAFRHDLADIAAVPEHIELTADFREPKQ